MIWPIKPDYARLFFGDIWVGYNSNPYSKFIKVFMRYIDYIFPSWSGDDLELQEFDAYNAIVLHSPLGAAGSLVVRVDGRQVV